MIYLRTAAPEETLRAESTPAKLLMFKDREPSRAFLILENMTCIGRASLTADGLGHVLVLTEFKEEVSSDLIHHAFAITANEAIRSYHPTDLYACSDDLRMKAIFPRNLFYPKGEVFRRTVEEWRYLIPDSCFDREGYLIDQGRMNRLPFGRFSTKDKGCGWIAAYNILKLNGHEQTMKETAYGLSRFDPTGELFGENYFKLFLYLRRKGLPVKAAFGRKAAAQKMPASKNGILLYSRKPGSHYCAYRIRHDGSIYIFNAVYGKPSHRMDIDTFLSQYAKGFKVMLLYIAP